jgi:YegS/Rv2252/BmrU family lipid kinase
MSANFIKLLFIINRGAGKNKTDWPAEIVKYFADKPFSIELFELANPCSKDIIAKKIKSSAPDRVIAVGGDGTLKLLAEIVQGKDLPVGLLPGGSANGMARELEIPLDATGALDVIVNGRLRKIHLVKINDELCIHLSDIGFNAYVVKKFENEKKRGMWSYVKSAWKVLWAHDRMNVKIKIDDEYIVREAAMVVIANATKYGTGVVINPEGTLDDDFFEVIIVKKISLSELFKMRFLSSSLNPDKTELLHTRSLKIVSKHKIHFQVDGEYLGKVKTIDAEIIPSALTIISPFPKEV